MNSFLPLFFYRGDILSGFALLFAESPPVLCFFRVNSFFELLLFTFIFFAAWAAYLFLFMSAGRFFNFPGQKSKSEKIIRFFGFLYCQHLRHIDLFHRLRRGKSCLYHCLTARHIRFYGIKQCFRDLRIARSQRYHRRRK